MRPNALNDHLDLLEERLNQIEHALSQLPNKHYIELRAENRHTIADLLWQQKNLWQPLKDILGSIRGDGNIGNRIFSLRLLVDRIGIKISQAEQKHLPPVVDGTAIVVGDS